MIGIITNTTIPPPDKDDKDDEDDDALITTNIIAAGLCMRPPCHNPLVVSPVQCTQVRRNYVLEG